MRAALRVQSLFRRAREGRRAVPESYAARGVRRDVLAAQGVVFENAYSQIAVCTPSRNSFMTGRRPCDVRARLGTTTR